MDNGYQPKIIGIEVIEPNDYNANEMTLEEFSECKAEVEHLGGIPKPIVVRPENGKYIIIDGEHNYRAAKDLGFDELPCEVLDVDIYESMRQTYKRNLHGTFNKVKLGWMFKRSLEEQKISLRDLASQYDISEGTVRNYLLYAKSSELRNDYAFEKLSVKQIRIYLDLPELIRDVWLNAGADKESLIWSECDIEAGYDKFEKIQRGYDANPLEFYFEMAAAGLGEIFRDVLRVYDSNSFRTAAKTVWEFKEWEKWLFREEVENIEFCKNVLRPYTILYLKESEKSRGEFTRRVLPLLNLKKNQPTISPEEFSTIFNESKLYKCDDGYTWKNPRTDFMVEKIKLTLIQKGCASSFSDFDKIEDPHIKLDETGLKILCPYIYNAKIPLEVKLKIWKSDPLKKDASDKEKAFLDEAKKELARVFGKKGISYEVYDKIDGMIRDIVDKKIEQDRQQKVIKTPELGYVRSIVKNLRIYEGVDGGEKKRIFIEKLEKLDDEELMALERASYHYWGYETWYGKLDSFVEEVTKHTARINFIKETLKATAVK